jgi:hypothetical protein
MTDKTPRRERLRPGELVGLAAVVAAFIGLVTFMVTRDGVLALIFFGATFVIDLIVLAMLMLAITPNKPADGEQWQAEQQGPE